LEVIELKASQRSGIGKGPARRLRRKGLIPAVLYGPETESIPLAISSADLDRVYKKAGSEHVLLNLIIENGDTREKTAIIKEVQTSPLTNQYLHVDFCEISLEKKIVVKVPVELSGKSKGVERGGLLQLIRHELEVECLPMDIPDKILVDVSNLGIGDSLHVGDIDVGKKVRLLDDADLAVVTIIAPSAKEEEVSEEELEEAEEAPAVEGEAK